ncbi:MAG: formate/nitrite transporter family protein [Deltaproteobacteria bacterium]|nr:formate/nitrite transporter family protein [Deltaproteobacteria bacterium]
MTDTGPQGAGQGDAYSPSQVASRARDLGVTKVRNDTFSMFALAVLAGAFISLGALLFVVVNTGSALGFGATRLLAGVGFSLGLILVVVAGAELFTGNVLTAMAWASGLVSFREVLRSWVIVYIGNLCGALATVALVFVGRVHEFGELGAFGETLRRIAAHKLALHTSQAFALGVLGNALVCLAVWLTLAARSVTDKVLAVVFPVTAFVAIGFEHSIANMFLLPWALTLDGYRLDAILGSTWNIVVVTLGNIAGGTLLVAAVYWTIYLRKRGGP